MPTTTSSRALVGALLSLALALQPTLAHPGRVDQNGCHQDAGASKKHCHAERARANAPKFDAAHPPRAGDEGAFHGPLLRVKDGDTLAAKVQGVAMEFRLAEVDAPELHQPYGDKSKQELQSLIAGRYLVIVPFDTDRYGRTVAHIWAGSTHLNAELVKRGAAWFYDAYSRGDALYYVEQDARKAKRGLWALPLKDRLEPWVWRADERR
jgi:endonuclease YncB( thermonuclease family)